MVFVFLALGLVVAFVIFGLGFVCGQAVERGVPRV
jgi:hypothetical protein